MCWSRKVNHYPDIASLKFTLIRRWLSPKISRNLHKPKFWWIQRLFWCKKIWIDLSGKTHCKARPRFITTRHPSAAHWPQGSCEESGIRSRNTGRQDANRQKNYYSHTMLTNDCAWYLRFNGIKLSQKPLFQTIQQSINQYNLHKLWKQF